MLSAFVIGLCVWLKPVKIRVLTTPWKGEEVLERCINLTVGGYALTSQVGSTVGEQDAEIKKSNFGTVISTSPITKKKKKKDLFWNKKQAAV